MSKETILNSDDIEIIAHELIHVMKKSSDMLVLEFNKAGISISDHMHKEVLDISRRIFGMQYKTSVKISSTL